MHRVLVALSGIGGLVMLSAAGGGADTVGASARGNYIRPSAIAGTCRRGGLDVSTTVSGTTGMFAEAAYDCTTHAFNGDSFVAQAACMAVTGKTAVISGRIVQATGMFTSSTAIQEVVVDNATPGSPQNPDRVVNQPFTGSPTCSRFASLSNPLPIQGDIVVTTPN